MKLKEITFTVTYKEFEKGEKVRPTSSRCPLSPGEYVITECHPPLCAGDETIVFVEGREHGLSAEYITSVNDIHCLAGGTAE